MTSLLTCAACGALTIWGSLATPDELARTTCADACPAPSKPARTIVDAIRDVVPGLAATPHLEGAHIEGDDIRAAFDKLYATDKWCGVRPKVGETRAWIYPRRARR